ncbi:hypothetical protein Poli38472_010271 [Pythium oligandrum]|uniref:GOLD domain-containing protein n=1 Tax=Pythium oligandrum TaxID=41045 RepID=A0A8K1FGH7_PYTOL|nr:hypothetical protein Poli38472_010271 [Pythium oligandrum]|eukprot:TMW58712.1 hypothetical protein Poli38472_010271 [Pythium oligandrum]
MAEGRQITPLHVALWNGNLNQIEDGLKHHAEALETRDPRGNRALHLALKISHRNSKEIVKRLLAAGARVRSRDLDGWKAVHHAVASENEDILRLLIQREKAQAPALLQKKITNVSPRLSLVPDFYGEIHVDVSTWIPGVSRWLPSDTVKIWKRGSDIRFDITLVGFENGAWVRGNLSFLLLGDSGTFVCMDHNTKTCTNLLAPGHELANTDLDHMVHFLMTTSIMTSDIDASSLSFERKRAWLSNSFAKEDIGRWKDCNVYEMRGMVASLHIRRPQNPAHKSASVTQDSASATKDTLSALVSAASESYAEVDVQPKADHIVSAEVSQGETVSWKFKVDVCDIAFSVCFIQEPMNGTTQADRDWEEVAVPRRYRANGGTEHAGSFTAPNAGTVVLVWDNTYSIFRPKHLSFQISVSSSDDTKSERDNEWDSHRATEKLVSFEQWFGTRIDDLPSELQYMLPKHHAMVHMQPPNRTMRKVFPATVYMSDAFPLSVHEFLPVIEVLSKTTSVFEHIQEFFNASLGDGFPVQFCFPLVPSVSATLRFDSMTLMTPEKTLFSIPTHYQRYQEDVLSPRTHQEVLQNLTAV